MINIYVNIRCKLDTVLMDDIQHMSDTEILELLAEDWPAVIADSEKTIQRVWEGDPTISTIWEAGGTVCRVKIDWEQRTYDHSIGFQNPIITGPDGKQIIGSRRPVHG